MTTCLLRRRPRASLAVLTLALAGMTAAPALPLPDDAAGLRARLEARFLGDRSGACVQALLIDGPRSLRASTCAGTRADPAPPGDAGFEIGSITKTMTAYLVADLIEQGRWSLDDPIARHLPTGTALPSQGARQILVRDLLTHSAGLPAVPPGMPVPDLTNFYGALTEEGLLAVLGATGLQQAIGSRAVYSNFGMMLVSLAVARAYGGDLAGALQRRLFEPLGMRGAGLGDDSAALMARGHLPGGLRAASWQITPSLGGFGAVRATLADMERYARAELGEAPADVLARLRMTQQPLGHGFAMNWRVPQLQGRTLLTHDGATGGFSALMVLEPAAHRAVVLLADTSLLDLGGLDDLGLSLLGLDVPVQAPRRAIELPTALRHELAGDYAFGDLALRLWESADGRLMARFGGREPFELRLDSRGDLYPLTFSGLLEPGTPPQRQLRWHQAGGLVLGRRVDPTGAGASPGELSPSARTRGW